MFDYKKNMIRVAAILSAFISFFMNFLFVVIFIYGDSLTLQAKMMDHRGLQWGQLALHFVSNFLIAFILYLINFSFLKSIKKSYRRKLILDIFVTLVAAILLSIGLSMIVLSIRNLSIPSFHMVQGGILRDLFISIVVILSSQVIYWSDTQQKTALENEILVAENIRSHYETLKNQVNPHFLFNSLNTLNSLVISDPNKAQDYIQKLSTIFRYTLQNKDVISLGEELEFTKAYCHMMQIRYGENLHFNFQTNDNLNNLLVIPMAVQMLVENAVHHNVISAKQPLEVIIKTSGDNTLAVINDINSKKENNEGNGIGLYNLAERYRLMWHKEINIHQTTTRFEVEIPLVRN